MGKFEFPKKNPYSIECSEFIGLQNSLEKLKNVFGIQITSKDDILERARKICRDKAKDDSGTDAVKIASDLLSDSALQGSSGLTTGEKECLRLIRDGKLSDFFDLEPFRTYAESSIDIDKAKTYPSITPEEYKTHVQKVQNKNYNPDQAKWLVYDYVRFKTGEDYCVLVDMDDIIDKARKEADSKVADAEANASDATRKRVEAEKKQKEAEEIAGNALNVARKEFEDEKVAATAARLQAEEDQRIAREKTDEAQEAIRQAEKDVNAARMLQLDAKTTADREISNAREAERNKERAYKTMWRAIVTTAAITVIAVGLSVFSQVLLTTAASSAAFANAELAKYQTTFDKRLSDGIKEAETRANEAVSKAEAREAEAIAKFISADQDHKQARAKQESADQALAKAMEEQRIANTQFEEAEKTRLEAETDKNLALERKKLAEDAENRATALKQEADQMKNDAERMMQQAQTMVAEAKIDEAVAQEAAKQERARRMGVEAMVEAGAPLRFPLENNEQGNNAPKQGDTPSPPVSSSTTPLSGGSNPVNAPKRTAKEILHDITWSWCLEGEFGIESESGLIGEVTEKPRTGYRASLQGNLVSLKSEIPQDIEQKFSAMTNTPREDYEKIVSNLKIKAAFGVWNESSWTPDARRMLAMHGYDFDIERRAEKENICFQSLTTPIQYDVAPRHSVKFDRRYMLAHTEVTQELWESVMKNNPSRFNGTQRPVENVSWEDCQKFIEKLNGMKKELGVPQGYEFTLPSETEWEHACRTGSTTPFESDWEHAHWSGSTTPFYFGWHWDDEKANGNKSTGTTSSVKKYPHNRWGLYDMHGNVWEWCQDEGGYGPLLVGREYKNGNPSEEGRLPDILDNFYSQNVSILDEFYRSRRGGSWAMVAENCQSAYRSFGNPMRGHDDTGFRLCLAGYRSE